MNQVDHFDLDREDALRELGYQTLAARIRLQQRIARNSPMVQPDARETDECECMACKEWFYYDI